MKDITIKTLESRIDDHKQYSRMDSLFISSQKFMYRTYARTASNLSIESYAVQETGK